MNQPLNHMNLRPAATSTPAPQRPMAVSQPNLGKSQLRVGVEPRDGRSTERLWVSGCRRPQAPASCLLLLLGCILFPPPLPPLPGLSGSPGFMLPSQQPSLKNHMGLLPVFTQTEAHRAHTETTPQPHLPTFFFFFLAYCVTDARVGVFLLYPTKSFPQPSKK